MPNEILPVLVMSSGLVLGFVGVLILMWHTSTFFKLLRTDFFDNSDDSKVKDAKKFLHEEEKYAKIALFLITLGFSIQILGIWISITSNS